MERVGNPRPPADSTCSHRGAGASPRARPRARFGTRFGTWLRTWLGAWRGSRPSAPIPASLVGLLLAAVVGAVVGAVADDAPGLYGYRVVNTFPHASDAFTQGLLYHEGRFYESTGLYGASSLRRVDPESGEVLAIRHLPPRLFGEGLALWDDRLVQLTWRNRVGLVWDRETLAPIGRFPLPTAEGWGLTQDGERLILSDGSEYLHFLDPEDFRLLGRVAVRDRGRPVRRLNELEFVDGTVLANVWMEDRIARIDPGSGRVLAWIDLRGLLPEAERAQVDVLNGIAWDAAERRLFVTGKLWPALFEIELVPLR